MKRFSKVPITLYRMQPAMTPKLREKSQQLAKNNSSHDYIRGSNGLYNPFKGAEFKVPNGLSLRPMGLNLIEIFQAFPGKLFIFQLKQGLVLDESLTVILERGDHYSLQTTVRIQPQLFCKKTNVKCILNRSLNRKYCNKEFDQLARFQQNDYIYIFNEQKKIADQLNLFDKFYKLSFFCFYIFNKQKNTTMDFETTKQGQNSTNALAHLNMVQNLTRQADKDLQQYHKLVELFRQDLQQLQTKISNTNDEITDTTMPLIEALYRQLQMGMMNQKQQNNNFQDQLTDLKKQKSVLSQMINASFKRSQQLNEEVGHY